MPELWPRLWHLRLSHAMLGDPRVQVLDAEAFRALLMLIHFVGAGLVWTYTEPGDGSLPDDNKLLARLANVSPRMWRKVRPSVEQFAIIKRGRWHLNEPWVEVLGGGRLGIPLAIQETIAAREGVRCTYCGAADRPLEYDHIFPVSRGGTNEPSNLTLACEPCNRSKGARTLAEWMAGR